MNRFSQLLLPLFLLFSMWANAQSDTITVQTLTFDSTGRDYYFTFPDLPAGSYQKILMQYRMRCKDGLVSTGTDRNKGCGEWDYSCNTFITDTSLTDSVKRTWPSHVIEGFSGTTYNYSLSPTYDLIRRDLKKTSLGSVISESKSQLGADNNSFYSWDERFPAKKIHILYTLEELQAGGFTAGNITGLTLQFGNNITNLRNCRIAIKETDRTELSAQYPDTAGLQVVYFDHANLAGPEHQFNFSQNFNWSGTKGLLIEISCDAAGLLSIRTTDEPVGKKAMLAHAYGSMDFTGKGYLNLDDVDFSGAKRNVTFSCWVKGDLDFISSQNTTLFEGVDGQNVRQANVHLPWSDKNMYFDCGNDGSGYDRINKVAQIQEMAGNWKHWVFTKDSVGGKMFIFRDSSVFISGTGKNKPITIEKMNLGRSFNDAVWFYGQVENFEVWDTAVNQAMAKGIMLGDPAVLESLRSREQLSLRPSSLGFTDVSAHGSVIGVNGIVGIQKTYGGWLTRGFMYVQRPLVKLVRGQYSSVNTATVTDYDTLVHEPRSMLTYTISNNTPTLSDSVSTYPATSGKIWNEAGAQTGTKTFTTDKTVNITQLPYYAKYPQRLELLSFVTPYGIGLDLGPEGKMWEYDVSDFEPVLRGSKRLSMDFGGQYQEEIDIRFLFIKGTPPRVPLSIQQIWRVEQRSYGEINSAAAFEPREVMIPEGTAYAKIRSAVTGHGQEGEFISRSHKIDVNNGEIVQSWNVWKACGDNPVYPQGGTWTFDRAGWCPGMATDLRELDISDVIVPNQAVQVKYTISPATGDSRYIPNHQIVTYGAAAFVNDVALMKITKPTELIEYGRFNPACTSPEVVIRNYGSTTLTSATFEYWVDPANKKTYQWTGVLPFMREVKVKLPLTDHAFWTYSGPQVFHVKVANPNDEYAANNEISSAFSVPPVHGKKVVITYKTNLYPGENSYTVKDIAGNTIISKSGFTSSKLYNDTLNLEEGCYKLEFMDTGNDGLFYWYWDAVGQPHGTGFLHFRDMVANTNKVFQPEFGSRVVYEFSVSNEVGIDEVAAEAAFTVFPNPSQDRRIMVQQLSGKPVEKVMLRDHLGRVVTPVAIEYSGSFIELDLGGFAAGVYYLELESEGRRYTQKVVLL